MPALIGFINGPDWLLMKDILTALLTPTLAVFVISQYIFNRTRRLQVTADKRQAVFVAMMKLASYLIMEGKHDPLDARRMGDRTAEYTGVSLGSACLFAPEDRLRIIEFNKKAHRISTLAAQTMGAHNAEIDALLEWFEREYDSVTNAASENKSLFWT